MTTPVDRVRTWPARSAEYVTEFLYQIAANTETVDRPGYLEKRAVRLVLHWWRSALLREARDGEA